jgi:PAS domain-containing protein
MAKIAEESFPGADERFCGMFAAALPGIAICTIQGRVLQAKPALCRMLRSGEHP